MIVSIEEARLQELMKQAFLDAMRENREALQEMIEEALEDIAMGRAIEEGKESGRADREAVFSLLRQKP